METELQRGHDAEVAATATYFPKEILVFGGTRRQQPPVGGDYISSENIVNGESEFGVQITPTAAKRQARHANRRDNSLGCGQTERLCLAVEFPQLKAGFRAHSPPGRIDTDAFHSREINHETAIANRLPRNAVTSAAHGN
jgi:hypothetical protein